MSAGTYSRFSHQRITAAALGLALLAAPAAALKAGGAVTLGMELDIPGFDPLKVGVYDTAARSASALMFDTLTRLDDEGLPQPKLAQSWTASEDFKIWTFKLQPGVKFSDGTPFNAQALKFNYDRMRDPQNHCSCAFYLSNIEQVDAPDELAFAVDGIESRHGADLGMWRPELAGPQGPMQVSLAAALDVGGGDRFDLRQNRLLGRAYLAQMFRRYGNWADALAAYNWGPGNLDNWIAGGRSADRLPLDVFRYVARVLRDSLVADRSVLGDVGLRLQR